MSANWNPPGDNSGWSLNPSITFRNSRDRHGPGEYALSTEATNQKSKPPAKKRPSRAGTRSISKLTQAQLDRKRSNDRDAQRAIRQRTKNFISDLQKQIIELQEAERQKEHRVTCTEHQNNLLAAENNALRCQLKEAGCAPPESLRERVVALSISPPSLQTQHSNDSSIYQNSNSTPRSFSARSHSPQIRDSSSVDYLGNATLESNVAWRTSEIPLLQTKNPVVQELDASASPLYTTALVSSDRDRWHPTSLPYQYTLDSEQQRNPQFDHTSAPMTSHTQSYCNSPVSDYVTGNQHQHPFTTPPMEFTSQTAYQSSLPYPSPLQMPASATDFVTCSIDLPTMPAFSDSHMPYAS